MICGNDGNLPRGTCRQANTLANTMEHVLSVLIGLMEGIMGPHEEAVNLVWVMNSCQREILRLSSEIQSVISPEEARGTFI